jgi:hypothetical protein
MAANVHGGALRPAQPTVVLEELPPEFVLFGHGWAVDGVVVEGEVVAGDTAGVVGVVAGDTAGVVGVVAAPETTVPTPTPNPMVLPAMPMPNRIFLKDDVMCSSPPLSSALRPRAGHWWTHCPHGHLTIQIFGPAVNHINSE